MKTHCRLGLVAGILTCVMIAMAFPASAQQDEQSTYSGNQISESKSVASDNDLLGTGTWENIDGKTYYRRADGSYANRWEYIDGGWYWFDPDTSALVTGPRWITISGYDYYLKENNAAAIGLYEVDGAWYYFSNCVRPGKQVIDGATHWFGDDGKALTGLQTIDGQLHFLDEQGKEMETSDGWIELAGKKYYRRTDGSYANRWEYIDNGWYWFDPDTSALVTGPQWITISGYDYYLKEDNTAAIGLYEVDGAWYYFSNCVRPGKQVIDGVTHWFGEDGRALVGLQTIDGQLHFLDEQGKEMETSDGWIEIAGEKYYRRTDGSYANRWEYIDNGWYWFDPDTSALVTGPRWITISGYDYYLKEDNAAAIGLYEVDGAWYYFSNCVRPGKQVIDGATHWFGDDGKALTGLQTIDGQLHFLDEQGKEMKTSDGWIELAGQKYYQRADGSYANRWEYIDGGWYWFDPDTSALVTGPRWITISGYDYYLKEDNAAAIGLYEVDGAWYYFSNCVRPGKQVIDGATHWFGDDGKALTGLQTIDGQLHFLDEQGKEMETSDGWIDFAGQKYYQRADGSYANRWEYIDNGWYWFDPDTSALVTGPRWITISGYDYYLKEDNAAAIGLYEVDGAWYYFSNCVRPGKQVIDGATHWFGDDGKALTGLQTIDGVYYLLDEQGKSVFSGTGYQQYNGGTYYVREDGSCANRWEYIGDGWYWFDPDTSALVTGPRWITISGYDYYLKEDNAAAIGLYEIDGDWYYFRNNLQKGWFVDADGNRRYSNQQTGILNTEAGLYTINGAQYYLLPYGIYVAPPVINSVLYTVSGQTATVTITATASTASALDASAYSWDGGKTWTSSASKDFAVGTTIAGGTIQVRDAVGNITVYGSDLKLTGSGPYMGIDVSAYQGVVDWAAVKASGVDFAIIRALTWSNSVGYYVIDPYFEYNVRSAKANGIDVGVYLFSYAFNVEEIKEEINFFHNSAEMKRLRADGIKFDYPVYIDFEWNTILEKTTYSQRTEMLRTGMIILEKYGYFPGFYSSMSWALNQYDAKGLYEQGYHFWCARYPANPDISAGTGSWLGFEAQMWQYASDGKVNGVSGNVDMNICYVDYSSIISGSGSGGGSAELTLSVYDVNSQKQVTGSVTDILSQVVMNEVGSWGNTEVCKAQAVAAYSWILYQQQHGNVIPSVGLATPTQAVKDAVKQVAGQALYYNGSAANAAYGSASGAYTNTAANMWSLNLPYLNTPVSSPETAYRGKSTTVKLSTMQNNIVKLVGSSLANSTPHSQWITDPVFDANGYLTSIKVCGKTVSGGTFYENCWGLLSPKFTMTYNAAADTWTFVTDGNGHCVGMSQYGAYEFAKSGWTYQQILAHYYPGTTLR